MTIGELLALAGGPRPGTGLHRDQVGLMVTYSWRGTLHDAGDGDGWWWAVTCNEVIFALGWTSGDHLARDVELGQEVAAQLHTAATGDRPS